MQDRGFPRIQLPLLVEVKHPTLGGRRCLARDISEGGVFVQLQEPEIKVGAKLKLTVLNPISVETTPTPTVEMEVKRVEADGLGLAFKNTAGRHLWKSVERLRSELAIGRDYFQVHLSTLVVNEANAILLVQQHGRWTLPGAYLTVGEDWRQAALRFLESTFNLRNPSVDAILTINNEGHSDLPEAAMLDVYLDVSASSTDFKISETSRYRDARWVDRRRFVEEATFANDLMRELVNTRLMQLIRKHAGMDE
jgi:ADP-ribose pyrophosphatase YjhB (NUDIX family)